MIDVVLVTIYKERDKEIRIGRWICTSKSKKVSRNRSDGTRIGECLMRAIHQAERWIGKI